MTKVKWSEENLNKLKSMYEAEIPIKIIAEEFGVTENAISSTASRKGITSKHIPKCDWSIKRRCWTKGDLWKLQEMYSNPGIEIEEIAEYFNVSISAVKIQASKNLIKRGKYEEEGKKVCTKCGKMYPATEEYFHKTNKTKIGLIAWCKPCWREYKNLRNGSDLSRKKFTEIERKYIKMNYGAGGLSTKEMAQELGCTVGKIYGCIQSMRRTGKDEGLRRIRKPYKTIGGRYEEKVD